MNKFAWNITLDWNPSVSKVDFDYIENLSKNWNKVLFVFWETELSSSEELITMLKDKLWEMLNHDISISTENKLNIVWESYEEWLYELASFEWEEVDFAEIVDRFVEVEEVVSIREAEVSKRFWNRVIKVDFVY